MPIPNEPASYEPLDDPFNPVPRSAWTRIQGAGHPSDFSSGWSGQDERRGATPKPSQLPVPAAKANESSGAVVRPRSAPDAITESDAGRLLVVWLRKLLTERRP